ncbi:polysaccharide biosynthesis protein [Candidatus Sumerlaeota bacterium]|nr:polysaccharide biosynthesis protein [Candidatus Sumerlaeota bacterium]
MYKEKIKWILLDSALVAFAFLAAYLMRFLPVKLDMLKEEYAPDFALYLRQALYLIPFFIVLRVLAFHLFDLYRGIARYAGMHEMRQIVLAVTSATAVLIAWDVASGLFGRLATLPGTGSPGIPSFVPWPVIAADWMGCLILVGGARMADRMWRLTRFNSAAAIHNVVIVGAGEVGELLARHFLQNPHIGFRPVGFVDENEKTWGRHIHGLTVYGGVEDLPGLIEETGIVEVIVAVSKPPLKLIDRIVEICERAHVGFKIVPAVSDVMAERVSISQIRNVEIEDLLGRESVDLTLSPEMNYVEGETVLVTGAGGSIGSELCRQILLDKPRRLLLFGRGENSLYEIATELHCTPSRDDMKILVGDIQDVTRLQQVFERYRPTVVFHAAAHKHVPLMELHPAEAVKNNVVGTFNVAYLATKYKAKRFILISTDKAVRPSSVMGVTKRVAEMIVSAFSRDSETGFIAVRFGNVLGSRGSVVPKFRKQIAAGGPVTVTHPEVERFFMTIPEAVNLVRQAGALGSNGQMFLLDMGEPVRIADLARRMITLSGFEPGVDIDIEYIGLMPGEKLKEELLAASEDLQPTEHPKIYRTNVEQPTLEQVKSWLKTLTQLLESPHPAALIEELQRIAPDYTPSEACRAPDERLDTEGSRTDG